MGTKIITPPIGVNCLNWDPPAETPAIIWALFWEILKGDHIDAIEPKNNHIFKLEQFDGLPCHWEYKSLPFGWQVRLGIDAGQVWLYLADTTPGPNYYFSQTKPISPPVEFEIFTNWYQGAPGNYGYQGYATIFWMERITELAIEFGLDSIDDLMLEMFGVGDSQLIVKLCSYLVPTNTKIKFAP